MHWRRLCLLLSSYSVSQTQGPLVLSRLWRQSLISAPCPVTFGDRQTVRGLTYASIWYLHHGILTLHRYSRFQFTNDNLCFDLFCYFSLVFTPAVFLAPLVFSLLVFSVRHNSKPHHWRSHCLSPRVLNHQETVNMTSLCHKKLDFLQVWACAFISCVWLTTPLPRIKTSLCFLARWPCLQLSTHLWSVCGRNTQSKLWLTAGGDSEWLLLTVLKIPDITGRCVCVLHVC